MIARARLLLTLGVLVAGVGFGSSLVVADESEAVEQIHEHLAYCRWKEALAGTRAWRTSLVDSKSDPEPADAVEARVAEERKNPKLDFLYLTRVAQLDDAEYLTWEVRFVSRPKVTGSCRVNVYVQTDTRLLRMTSRFYADLVRGEHLVRFAWHKVWESAEGKPISMRAELCYEKHCVDHHTLGPAPAKDWWKRAVAGSLLHFGTDGQMTPEDRTMRIVDTETAPWSPKSVTETFRRSDRRGNVPFVEGTDVLPDDEPALPDLPRPRAGYVPKYDGAPGGPVKPSDSTKPSTAKKPAEDLPQRVLDLATHAVYGPDRVTLERSKSLSAEATAADRQDLVDQLGSLAALAEASSKADWRGALRIKKLDVQKPTADTEGLWMCVVVFQATRALDEPFRINLYTLVDGKTLYGTQVVADGLVWDGPSQEFAYVFAIDELDLPSTARAAKWRVEIGWNGVCCGVKETAGNAPAGWWLEPPAKAHRSRSGAREAPGRFRVGSWGIIRESTPSDRLTARVGR